MRRRRVSLGRVLAYVLAIVLSAWIIFPIYLITISAFSSFDAIYVYPRQLLPRDVSTDTIRLFLESDGIIDSLKRSIYVAAITIVACLAIGTPAGYALARFSFRGANPFQLALVSTRAFPLIIIAVPLAVTYLRIGIDDTVWGLAAAHVAFTLPLTVLITASVFAGISYELEEAAMTLGCSRLSAIWRVALPLARGGIAAAAIFIFVTSWNEVFAAAILTLQQPHVARADARGAGCVGAAVPPRRRLLHAGTRAGRHLHHPQVPRDDVGAGGTVTPSLGSSHDTHSKGALDTWLTSVSRECARTSASSRPWTGSTSR